jgi:tRNA(Ile)-lysidine synthase
MRTIAGKVKNYSSRLNLLPDKGGLLLCAVSGGADSMCLLDIMREISKVNGFDVKAIHFNHGLRGFFADRDEMFVKEYCLRAGIVMNIGRPYVPLISNDENTARKARYAFFAERAAAENASMTAPVAVATAHNADDNAETVLMRLARGSGAKGLSGISPDKEMNLSGSEVRVVRPLLCVTRGEIDAYLDKRSIPHIEDETNSNLNYTRNRIRVDIMPKLREVNPKFSVHTLALSESLTVDDDCLEEFARKFLRNAAFSPQNAVFSRDLFLSEHPAIASRIIRQCAAMFGIEIYREQILETLSIVSQNKGGWIVTLPKGLKIKRNRELIEFTIC